MPRTVLHQLAVLLLAATALLARAETAKSFSATLTMEQKAALGLANATPAQLAALDRAVDAYRSTAVNVAAQQAATAAVTEYVEKEQPKVVAAALAANQATATPGGTKETERFTGILIGRFEGWSGNTVFNLDNGQIWKQASQDSYFPKGRSNVPVVIYRAPSGHWRLRILDDDGAWVTVKRLK